MFDHHAKVTTKSQWDKYVYTALLLFNHAAFGMTRHMFFSAMMDLKIVLNTTMNCISLFNTFVSLGYLLGSLFGFLYKYLNRQMTLAILLTVMSTASAFIPYSESLTQIYICGLAIGLGAGCWNGIANVWLIEIWRHKSAPLLQLIQFMFGVGTILSPLVNQLFLKDDDTNDEASAPNATFVNTRVDSSATIDEKRESLKTSFLINGVIQITIPILLVIMFLVKKYQVPDHLSCDKMDYQDKKAEHKKNLFKSSGDSPRMVLILLFAILFMFYNACEALVFQFGPSYFQNIPGLRLTSRKAAGLMSIMATSYTVGRGLNVLIAIKVRPKHMMQYHLCIVIVGFIALFFAQHSRPVLLLANVVMGFGFSAIFPAILAYLKQYIDITNKIGTILMFSSETVVSFTPYILGTFIEKYSIVFIIVEMVYFVLALFAFLAIIYLVKKTKCKSVSKLKLLDDNPTLTC